MSSLAMVLLILLLGSLLLNGLNQQRVAHIRRVTTESVSLRQYAAVQSAMEWRLVQKWPPESVFQCLAHPGELWNVCLRTFADNRALLAVASRAHSPRRGGHIPRT